MRKITSFIGGFWKGFFHMTPHKTCMRGEKKIRDNLDDDQIDAMIDGSFPASDPPSTY